MHSCIYEGWVWHERREPLAHSFRYALVMLYLDLDELTEAFRGRWLWSATCPSLAWFRRADYLGDSRTPLKSAVHELLASHGVTEATGPVRLLTQPRYGGFLMNPVSFYFCFDSSGGELRAVVAEVTNTPWRERQCYVLHGEALNSADHETLRIRKAMHVSPFLPLDMDYGWRLTTPGERLRVNIQNFLGGERVFEAALRLVRRPWTTANLARVLWRYPLMTQRIGMAIYWQALKLWWKGCPVFAHPRSRGGSTQSLHELAPLSPAPSKTL